MTKALLRLALCQINCTVGDLEGNSKKIVEYYNKALESGADIISFPELAITGYPPEDLLRKESFIRDNLTVLKNTAKQMPRALTILGYAGRFGRQAVNSAAIISKGKVLAKHCKMLLPNYGVFDEKRYFAPGKADQVFKYNDAVFGVNICEDIWFDDGPVKFQAKGGAKLIININASPFHYGKIKERQAMIKKRAMKHKVFISYVNLVGGQDELVFDGQSMVVSPKGSVIARASAFKEELLFADIELERSSSKKVFDLGKAKNDAEKIHITNFKAELQQRPEEIFNALVLGLKDYCGKNGFKKVVLGLSGGVDSALVAVIAADALGAENVRLVFMPSGFTSVESYEDAAALSKNLGITLMNIPILNLFTEYLRVLEPYFKGKAVDIAEENLQARIRGTLLMALSNKFGWLVIATGNKSEMSTGYATLYGDMAGGFALIKDLSKMLVYEVCRYRNTVSPVIPESILTKAPTAELKDNQKDQDTLPPYDVLDNILLEYIEKENSAENIVSKNFDKDTVLKVIGMVDRNEYKRRQAPPGIKISELAFGKDRRMPITNKYKG